MTDHDDKPSGTLKLKPRPKSDSGEEPRQRSGARARQIALRERTAAPKPAPAPAAPPDTPASPTRSKPASRPQTSPPLGRRPARDGANRSPQTGDGPRPSRSVGGSRPPREPARADEHTRSGQRPGPQRPPAQARSPRPATDASAQRDSRPRAADRTQPAGAPDGYLYDAFAPCPHGLEEALAAELDALGFPARMGRAGCHFQADWAGMQRVNLYSRLATRVLVQVAHAPVRTENDILDLAYRTPWERWFGPEHTLRVDTSAIRSPMHSLQYCNLRAKDGICDRLRDREGQRPDIDTVRPDARVHLFLDEHSATLYLDTSGESLFKRGWRLDKGEAPIRENLAAGLLALSGWQPDQALLDPFCGSGTILIEAAWIALGIPPGLQRPFAFERLRHHDARQWRDLKDAIRADIRKETDAVLLGVDSDPAAIEAARRNAARAGLSQDVLRFEVGDARTTAAPAPTGWLVTNPPYGERLDQQDQTLWREWSAQLKQHFHGWTIAIISSDLELPTHMRLKPRRRYPLHNGALDCRLFLLDMVAAGYRQS